MHRFPSQSPFNIACKDAVKAKITKIDGKMEDVVLGDSGAFYHYCDIPKAMKAV